MIHFNLYPAKVFLQHASGFSMDALHVIVGVMLQFLIAWLFRTSVARPGPLLAVFALEVLNEVNDYFTDAWGNPAMQFGEATKDIIMTMVLPTLIYAIARDRPKLLR